MNKVLFLALCAIALTACQPATSEQRRENITKCALEFEYKGHNYIYFSHCYLKEAGVVHDPDCKCGKGG